MVYLRGIREPLKKEDGEGILEKITSLFSSPEDGEDDGGISDTVCAIFDIAGEELCGYYGIPEDEEEAMRHIQTRLMDQEPPYGDPKKHRSNGFSVPLDDAVLHKCISVVQKKLEDDGEKNIRIRREPAGDGEHKLVIWVPRYGPEGEYKGFDEIESDPRPRKCELVQELAHIVDYLIPEERTVPSGN